MTVDRWLGPLGAKSALISRLRIGLALLIVAATATVLVQQPASAAPTTFPPASQPPASAAAGWLARQLINGDHFEATFDGQTFIDPGLTTDAVFAFAAAGVSGTNAGKAIAWLNQPDVTATYDGEDNNDPSHGFAAGPLAKLTLAAEVMGKDPTHFGGVDLVGLLLPMQQTNGRFVDSSIFGDFNNAFGQALAVIALHRLGGHDTEASKAAQYLISVQCSDGGFPLSFPTGSTGPCTSQTDATALVIQALLAVGDTQAATAGLTWLVGVQRAGGGFDDAAPTSPLPVNANSTGLAAEALRIGGRTAAADHAVEFLRNQQMPCTATPSDRGAINYDPTGFSQSTAVRATTQGILGLTGVGLVDLSIVGASPDAPTETCLTPTATPTPSSSAGAVLPVTGAPLTPVLFAGAALVLVGVALLVLLRRRAVAMRPE
jgi:hypothetical protein